MNDATGCYADCIETASGTMFDIVNPQPESVLIQDIAWGLSRICRFGGHCSRFYSVAEHSVHCYHEARSRFKSGELAFFALMHDAAEAYIGDITRPVKLQLESIVDVEDRIDAAIRKAFDMDVTDGDEMLIKEIDNAVLRSEAHELMPSRGEHWNWGDTPFATIGMEYWDAERARYEFTSAFERAMRNRGDA